jgi:membrane protein YqaA with SNARE-associated domain
MHEIFIKMNDFFQALGVQGLALNAFIESFFLVPPPDFLLITMDLLKPEKALFYALVCTVGSVAGAFVGYGIGYWGGRPAFNFLFPKHHRQLEKIECLYNKYGVAVGFLGAFSPFPYKIFTIASGILKLNLPVFIATGLIGRGGRFFLVSLVLMLFGEMIMQYIEWVIAVVTLVIIAFFVILYKKRKSFV